MCSLTIGLCIVLVLSVNAQVSYGELLFDDANKSTSIPSDWNVEYPSIVTFISVRNVNVNKINTGAFKDFTNLRLLQLTGRITVIEDEAFTGLDKLEQIELNGVGIQHIGPKVFYNLKSLTSLNMASNEIRKISLNLLMLTELNLSNNNITELSDITFINLKNLKYIDLSENKIRAIKSKTFAGCPSLATLNLNKNQIANIEPYAFRDLSKLEVLSLRHNNLTTVPEDPFSGLKNLKRFDLSHNLINDIGLLGFVSHHALTSLDLSHNKITSLDTLWLPTLTEIRLDHNSITSLPKDTFIYTRKLEYLDLGFNLIKEFYLSNDCNRLRRLNLKHNQLDSIKLLATTQMNIEVLDLSDNNLTHLDESFQHLINLETLSLTKNKIKSFPLCIPGRLTHFDLSHNELHGIALDKFCGSATQGKLQIVDLSANQFTSYNLTYSNKSLQETQPDLNEIDLSVNLLNADSVKQIEDFELRHIKRLKTEPQRVNVIGVSSNESTNGKSKPSGKETTPRIKTTTEKTAMATSVENIESQRTPMIENNQNSSTNEDWNLTGNRGNHENETTIQNTTALAPVDKSDQNEKYTTWIAVTSAALAVGVFAVIAAILVVCKQRRRTNPNPNVNDAIMLNELYDDVRPARADDDDRSSPDYDYPRFPPLYDDVGVQPTYLAVLPDIPGAQPLEQEDMESEENHYEEIG